VLPNQIIAKTLTPDGGELVLVRRGDEWSIRVARTVLMSSRQHASEEGLAEQAFLHVPAPKHVLVGGLGLGYTLRAVLDKLAKSGKVTVAELLPDVVAWNHQYLGPLAREPLNDPRCEVVLGDVYEVIKRSPQSFDIILLDVDNGPVALSDAGNQRLYNERSLRACFAALRPKGALAVWSSGPSPSFDGLLARVGFKVATVRVAKAKGAPARHVVHIGLRP
jgi:spermidine synthase